MEKHLNKVICGDCFEVMQEIPDKSIDLLVTDPPYELVAGGGRDSCFGDSIKKCREGLNDINKGFDYDEFFKETKRILKKYNAFIFCSNKQIIKYLKFGENNGYQTTVLVWWKYNSTPFCNGTWKPDIEYIVHIKEAGATFQGNAQLKNKVDQLPIQVSKYGHPTEKPLNLVSKYILIGSNEGDIVLDPFLGSGTTAEAAKILKRNYIGIEKEDKYCKVAKDRLKQETLF